MQYDEETIMGIEVSRHGNILVTGKSMDEYGIHLDACRCQVIGFLNQFLRSFKSVLAAPLPASVVKSFLRFCSGCHGLAVDTGRRCGVPRVRGSA